MTTTVIVQAHCADDKEVVIQRFGYGQNVEETVINDGQDHDVVVYDGIGVNVFEREKENAKSA